MTEFLVNIDWQSRQVWFLLVLLATAIVLFTIALVALLRACKLVIPKSKLNDDAYVKTALKRIKVLRKVGFAVFWLFSITLIILCALHFSHIIDMFTYSMLWWSVGVIAVILLTFSFGLGPFVRPSLSMKRFFNAEDVLYNIGLKRNLHPPGKN